MIKIKCPNCPKVLVVPEERLPKDKTVVFPCPDCKGTIKFNLSSKPAEDETSTPKTKEKEHPAEKAPNPEIKEKEHLTGEALKNEILNTVKDLPPMPQTVLKAREIMADPKSGFQELADILEVDQAIAAKLLKMANSPYYGLRENVTSIQKASVVLGHKTLGELITMGGISTLLGNRLEGYGLDAGDLWKHGLAVAFGSKLIAEKIKPELANDAFTSGLLHDSGKLILDGYISERWQSFEEVMSDGQHTFLDAEKEVLELSHPEIASEVCKTWKIPETLTLAIRYHHNPSQSNESKLAYIVHVADATAMMTGMGIGIDGTLYHMEENAMDFLGLKEEDLADIMGKVLISTKQITGS